ncbi:MAG: transglutaminase-like domain-containing protein [Candidatus Saccharibacteria bacterium]|nr:transglutaminase-like domain-containing protein [Candidatus Saccharibacteria bacterium]
MILPLSGIVKASVVYPEYHPQDIINNEPSYDEVFELIVEGDEARLLSQINFNKYSQLKGIRLARTAILDGSIINLENPIPSLNIINSIVNLASFDLNDYTSVSLASAYVIGDMVENPKIHIGDTLNEEYKLKINNLYGLQTHEKRIDEIAKEIYTQSDGTNMDIVRLVTLYVIEHIEYDINNLYTDLPAYDSIINHEKGVCTHYSGFESRLLNKLGIFAISTGGCSDLKDCMHSGHAWTIAYIDDNWYYIDPTWIDDDESINALKTKDYQSSQMVLSWYMIPANDASSLYATERKPDFTMYNSIPIEYRTSKLSILDKKQEENEQQKESQEAIEPPINNNAIKVPDTGVFTPKKGFTIIGTILYIITTIIAIIFLITKMIRRIFKKHKSNSF